MVYSKIVARVKTKTTVAVGFVTSVVAGLCLATSMVSAGSGVAQSLKLSGTVYTADGKPSANTTLVLKALDESSYPSTIIPGGNNSIDLAKVATDGAGHFTFDSTGCCSEYMATLSKLAAAHNGDVNMEVMGSSSKDGVFVISDFSAHFKDEGGQAAFTAQSGEKNVSNLKLQANRGLVETVASPITPGPFLTDDPNPSIGGPTSNDVAVQEDRAQNADSVRTMVGQQPKTQPEWTDPISYCEQGGEYGGYFMWRRTGTADQNMKNYPVPVQKITNRHVTTSGYQYQRSNSDSAETKFGFGAQWHGVQFSAGKSHSAIETTAAGYSRANLGHMTTLRMKVNWQYWRWQGYCARNFGPSWYMDVYKWVPHDYAGAGTVQKWTLSNWTCLERNKVDLNGAAWFSFSGEETLGYQMGVLAVGSWQHNSSYKSSTSDQTSYNSHNHFTHLCGSNTIPTHANFLRETDV